jgi:hypothetical protein
VTRTVNSSGSSGSSDSSGSSGSVGGRGGVGVGFTSFRFVVTKIRKPSEWEGEGVSTQVFISVMCYCRERDRECACGLIPQCACTTAYTGLIVALTRTR